MTLEKIQTRLAILVGLVIGLLLIGLFVLQRIEESRVRELLVDRATYKHTLIGDLLTLHRAQLATSGRDFATGEGLGDFISRPDSTWANQYLPKAVSTFNIDGLWILDSVGSTVYSAATGNLIALNQDKEFLSALMTNARIADSGTHFVQTRLGVMEVYAAPIAADNSSSPAGFAVTVRHWSTPYVNELARVAGIQLRLVPTDTHSGKAPDDNSTLFKLALVSTDGRQVAELQCTGLSGYHDKIAAALVRERRYLWVVGILSIVLLCASLFILISIPLRQISHELADRRIGTGSTDGSKSIFGHIGQSIQTFYRQQANLVAEITERRRAEAALTESEQRFRMVTEQTGQLIYDWDMETDKATFTGAIEELTAYAPAEYTFATLNDWIQTVHPDDREGIAAKYDEICSRDGKGTIEYRLRRRDGSFLSVENSGIVLKRPDGVPYRMLGTVKDVTDRKRAESAVKANATLLKTQFGMSQMIDSTEEQIVQYAVKSAVRMLGSSFGYVAFVSSDEAAFTVCSWSKNHESITGEDASSHLQSAGSDGPWAEVVQQRVTIIRNDGAGGLPETHHRLDVPMFDGGHIAVVAGVSDSTVTYDESGAQQLTELLSHLWGVLQRKRSEDQRAASELLYRAIFDNANDAIFLMSGDTFVDCNVKTLEFFGCARHEIIGQPPYRFSPELQPDGRQSAEKAAERINAALAGHPQHFEWLHCKLDSTPIETEVCLNRFEVSGNVMLLAVVRDVSKRRAAERQLERTQELLNAAFVQSPYGILVASAPDVVIEYANPGAKLFRGFGTGELQGANWLEHTRQWPIYRPDGITAIAAEELPLARAIREGVESSGVEVVVHYGPDDFRWLTISAAPIRSKDGTIIAGVAMIQDVTENKKAQEQQQQLEDKLQRAKRMESLGVLAGGVAHDLNNMLGPVVGYSELLLRQLESQPKLADKAGKIMKAARDAADVIQDLLTLARRGRYEMVPLDLNEVVKAYLESPGFASLKARHQQISIELALTDAPAPVHGSSAHLSKVIMNITANACEAMLQGGTLRLGTSIRRVEALLTGHARFTPGEFVVLTVRDSGVGIPEGDISKIFEPYYSKKQMGHSGTGLGLSVVYGVVKDHHGYYDVVSRIGEGTEFIFYFPICNKYSGSAVKRQISRGGSERILVVDDYQEQRDLAREILTSLGYQVSLAENGRQALVHLREQPADLVLLDMIMEPDFDGLDTFREIRKIVPHQKIIVVSGFSASERVQEMQQAGAGPYVRKPFTIDAIAHAVRSVLDEKPSPTPELAESPS